MSVNISYIGWPGHNNVGDDAIFRACNQLFTGLNLIDSDKIIDSQATIYGGGTLMPPDSSEETLIQDTYSAAIGVGVKEPEFRNQKSVPVDLGYYFGKLGKSELLENKFVDYILQPAEFLFESVKVNSIYIHDDQFEVIQGFDKLGIRGPVAGEILDRYGVDYEIVGDTALILEPTNYHRSDQGRIALTLRDGGPKWSSDKQYLTELTRVCEEFSDNYEFVLIPFAPEDIPLHLKMDSKLNNSVYKDYCTYQTDVQGVLDEYAACDVVLGEKLHASVLSACTHTPFISLGYQRKNDGFARSVGMQDYNIRIDEVSKEWLNDNIEQLLNSDSIVGDLEKKVGEKRDSLTDFAVEVEAEILAQNSA